MPVQEMDGEAQQLDTTLPAEPGSAPRARATVAEHSRSWGFGAELCEDATDGDARLLSELRPGDVAHRRLDDRKLDPE